MRLLLLAAVVMLSAMQRRAGARRDVPDAARCPVLEDRCRCSLDLQEFVCREAGFVEVPEQLPPTITKL